MVFVLFLVPEPSYVDEASQVERAREYHMLERCSQGIHVPLVATWQLSHKLIALIIHWNSAL